MIGLSFKRLRSLLRKEWIQVRRDPLTLRLIIAMPIMQLLLFGYAINTNPKHLPTGVLSAEPSKYERTLVAALQNTGYYDVRTLRSEEAAEKALAEGDLLFVVNFPPNFDRSVDRGESPSVLIDADATDPSAIGYATGALAGIADALNRDLPPIRQAQPAAPPFQFEVHSRYNPEQLSVLSIVPGLIGMVLIYVDAARHHVVDHARARTRHHGKSHGDAGAPDRDHARQDRALYRGRVHPGPAHSRGVGVRVPLAGARLAHLAAGGARCCSSPGISRSG